MAEEYLTVSEMARRAGLAESTARRYIKNYSEFFSTREEGQRVYYAAEGVQILTEAAKLFNKGLTAGQVRESLAGGFAAAYDVESEVAAALVDRTENRESMVAMMERQTKAMETISKAFAEMEWARQDKENLQRQLEQERETRQREAAELKARMERLESFLSDEGELDKPGVWQKLKNMFKK